MNTEVDTLQEFQEAKACQAGQCIFGTRWYATDIIHVLAKLGVKLGHGNASVIPMHNSEADGTL